MIGTQIVKNGIDTWLGQRCPQGAGRWGLVTNDAARTRTGEHTRIALLKAGVKLTALYAPEHGLSATGVDGQAQPHRVDKPTGLPIYSLYGETLAPDLSELDGLIFDLPDIGLRFYTYIWTLSYLLECCAKTGTHLLILDRINPLSGRFDLVEGPYLEEDTLSSFIGRWRLPIRHSLTVGELARYWQHSRKLSTLSLEVIACAGWQRRMFFRETGLAFTPPSPAINTPDTLLTYAALCFLEGVNVSEGRGTPFPFRQFGAPWLNREVFASASHQLLHYGVRFTPVTFTPKSGRYRGAQCIGYRLAVTEASTFRPIQFGLSLLAMLRATHPQHFTIASYPTWVNPTGDRHLALLIGQTALHRQLLAEDQKIIANLPSKLSCPDWPSAVLPHLLYE